MANPKDVLVITTSPVDGLKIKQYLRPISAHIVAGTNLFSDFLASFSDVFGGRSQTYQKQLISLYNEAIERIKFSAYEIGANCIIGLRIDMDEISGKGKSMFMLTAIGTAVILEKEISAKHLDQTPEKFENVGLDRIDTLRKKKVIIKKAEAESLTLDDETWDFITSNQVDEIFPYILKKYSETLPNEQLSPAATKTFHKQLSNFIDGLPENKKKELLYTYIANETNEQLALKLCNIVNELNLLDLAKSFELLQKNEFNIQKRGLWTMTYDKPYYSKQDMSDFENIRKFIQTAFVERGTRATKKQLLSSKEKEVWTCECGKANNEIGAYCSSCNKDIYGFKTTETKPSVVDNYIQQKIELISELIK
ncbi:MAG: YbjQ family protein [Bacteroidota bacterium]|nr:YbjQ family protein [Bacteroidota bacterium]